VSTSPHSSATENDQKRYADERAAMVRDQIVNRGISDQRILDAMRDVPRHLFVPPELHPYAYTDGPLPIGENQTISQPYIVAYMTWLLRPEPGDRVLEIGVGSGYQSAILSCLVREVVGIERVPGLAAQAQKRLHDLGYQNIAVHVGDGTLGFEKDAPYNGILVAAAAPYIPEPLLDQLADEGRLVIPVGNRNDQLLERVRRHGGSIHIERLSPVRFVPLVGRWGFQGNWY
jgi:protein-L-isoaspartate(D-aspartate) O-methyltransferase